MNTGTRLTIERWLDAKLVGDARLSPDGRCVAFVVAEANKTRERPHRRGVWVADAAGNGARQFTTGASSDHSPRWSPDGRLLAFLSDRAKPGQHQLYVMAANGGEARQVSDVAGVLSAPTWLADGAMVVLYQAPLDPDVEKRQAEGDDPVVADDNARWRRLHCVDLATGDLTPLSPEGLHVYEVAPSPDGRRFALVVGDAPGSDAWYRCRLVVLNGTSAPPLTLCAPSSLRQGQVAAPAWSPDGSEIAFLAAAWSDEGSTAGDIWTAPADGGAARCLTADYPASFTFVAWQPDGHLLAAGLQAGDGIIARIDRQGRVTTLWRDQALLADSLPRLSLADDGATFATMRQDATSPVDIWLGRVNGEWRRLTELRPDLSDLERPRVETVWWTSADGQQVQGSLMYPVGWDGRPAPLFVHVHGGPTASHLPRFFGGLPEWSGIIASRGYAVLLPNPRGSTGRGRAFAEANHGDLGGGDLADILAGVDHVVQLGVADAARLSIGGWSYGGFMTAWAITQTDRFKAAVVGAGIVNWESYYGQNGIHLWQTLFFGSTPLEAAEAHRARSPWHHLGTARTPTLILHGREDTDVPAAQAHELYRGLRDLGVPTQLVTYPREGHPIRERAHQRDLMTRLIGWLDRYAR